MLFKIQTIVAAALTLCVATPCLAAVTPAQEVANINLLTSKSQALITTAQSINAVAGPLYFIGVGPYPTIVTGLNDIVSTATTANTQLQGSDPVNNRIQATAILNAFRDFVRVHQQLENVLIDKADVLDLFPYLGAQVAAVLQQVKDVIDNTAFALIGLVSIYATDLTSLQISFDGTLNSAIQAYDSGFSKAKRAVEFKA